MVRNKLLKYNPCTEASPMASSTTSERDPRLKWEGKSLEKLKGKFLCTGYLWDDKFRTIFEGGVTLRYHWVGMTFCRGRLNGYTNALSSIQSLRSITVFTFEAHCNRRNYEAKSAQCEVLERITDVGTFARPVILEQKALKDFQLAYKA